MSMPNDIAQRPAHARENVVSHITISRAADLGRRLTVDQVLKLPSLDVVGVGHAAGSFPLLTILREFPESVAEATTAGSTLHPIVHEIAVIAQARHEDSHRRFASACGRKGLRTARYFLALPFCSTRKAIPIFLRLSLRVAISIGSERNWPYSSRLRSLNGFPTNFARWGSTKDLTMYAT
jgi:hypothetical protein